MNNSIMSKGLKYAAVALAAGLLVSCASSTHLKVTSDEKKMWGKNHQAVIGRADSLAEAGRHGNAVEGYSVALKFRKITDEDRAAAHTRRGDAYLAMEKYSDAVADYKELIRLKPQLTTVYYNYILDAAGAEAARQRYNVAADIFTSAIDFGEVGDTRRAEAYAGRGNANMHMRNYDAAAADYNEAIRLDFGQARTYFSEIAETAQSQDNSAIYTLALSLNNIAPADSVTALAGRGFAHISVRRFSEAREDFDAAMRHSPENARLYLGKGMAHAGMNDRQNALENFGHAIRLDPGYAQAHYEMGRVYDNMGDFDKAMGHYHDAIKLHEDYDEAFAELERLYDMPENYNRGMTNLNNAINSSSGNARLRFLGMRGNIYVIRKDLRNGVKDLNVYVNNCRSDWKHCGHYKANFELIKRTAVEAAYNAARAVPIRSGYDKVLWGASFDDVDALYYGLTLMSDNDGVQRYRQSIAGGAVKEQRFVFYRGNLVSVAVDYGSVDGRTARLLYERLTSIYGQPISRNERRAEWRAGKTEVTFNRTGMGTAIQSAGRALVESGAGEALGAVVGFLSGDGSRTGTRVGQHAGRAGSRVIEATGEYISDRHGSDVMIMYRDYNTADRMRISSELSGTAVATNTAQQSVGGSQQSLTSPSSSSTPATSGVGYGSGFGGGAGGPDDLLGSLMGGSGGAGRRSVGSTPAPSGGSITGGRTRSSITRTVNQNMASVRHAYNRRLAVKPELRGRIDVKFAIDDSGRVTSAQVVESTMNDPELEATVAERVKSWNFGKIDKPGDVTEVTYPFVFSQ